MKTYLDCIPCFARQALEAARLACDDPAVHMRILREVLAEAARWNLWNTPPAMGQWIHRTVRQLSGNPDPYRAIKQRCNALALDLYGELRGRVRAAADPLEIAVRLAVAGNLLDFGGPGSLPEEEVREAVRRCLDAPLHGDGLAALRGALATAQSILYVTDNAGEIVFDRLLLEVLPTERVTLAVKGAPVINDATREDAIAVGLTEMVRVIDSGSDAPGVLLDDCAPAFRQELERADLVIAKGQGNYETLDDLGGRTVFLLVAKCPVIARDACCEVGALVASFRDGGGDVA